MSIKHFCLGLLMAFLWGANFVAIKVGLQEIPPLFFTAMRFTLVTIPFIFLIPKPNVPWSNIVMVSLTYGFLKFSLIFVGLSFGVDGGIAAIILQTQVFFTFIFSFLFFRTKPSPLQIIAVATAFTGITMITLQGHHDANLMAILFIIGSAFFWGVANIYMQKAGKAAGFPYVVWTNLLPPIPLLISSFIFEDWSIIPHALSNITLVGATGIAYTAYVATMIGSTIWTVLIKHYGASTVAPFTMLVPISSMVSCYLFLGESLTPFTLFASSLVLAGLVMNEIDSKKKKAKISEFKTQDQPGVLAPSIAPESSGSISST